MFIFEKSLTLFISYNDRRIDEKHFSQLSWPKPQTPKQNTHEFLRICDSKHFHCIFILNIYPKTHKLQ